MTDPHPPLDDEQLSADLDGEAGPDVQARIAADPVAQARQAELRTAAELAAGPVAPLPDDVVDRLIAGAIDADGANQLDDERADRPVAPPVPLRRRRGGPPPWSVAAAVVALVVVGLGLVWSGRSNDRRDVAGRGPVAEQSAASTTASPDATNGGGSLAGKSAPTTVPTAPKASTADQTVGDLGAFPSAGALRAALAKATPRSQQVKRAAVPGVSASQLARCAQLVESGFPVGAQIETARATIAGEPVIVYVYRSRVRTKGATSTPPNQELVAVVDVVSCAPRLTFVRP
ncbi:MAG: hypothetical protein JWM05_3213 [Acidimicrobiales bacterium]|nr:hypothetical protein [Acidimicrobiales bacterium]